MDLAFNYAEKLNRDVEEKSPNFQPGRGYFDESRISDVVKDVLKEESENQGAVVKILPSQQLQKISEEDLTKIVSETVKRVLKEGDMRTKQQNIIRRFNTQLRDVEDEIMGFEQNNLTPNYQIPMVYKKIYTLFDNMSDCL